MASALELESNLSDRMGGPGLPNIPTASAFKNTSRTDVIGTLGTETSHFACAVIYIFAHELWVSKSVSILLFVCGLCVLNFEMAAYRYYVIFFCANGYLIIIL
jgi:hypothetical protein